MIMFGKVDQLSDEWKLHGCCFPPGHKHLHAAIRLQQAPPQEQGRQRGGERVLLGDHAASPSCIHHPHGLVQDG